MKASLQQGPATALFLQYLNRAGHESNATSVERNRT